MSTQPEALRLAQIVECEDANIVWERTAAELRRLHAVNAELLGALKETATELRFFVGYHNSGEQSSPVKALNRCDAAIQKAGEQA